MNLRPDEIANQSRMQKAFEQNRALKKTGTTALSIAASIGGGVLGSRILPFLNEFIPAETAIKGISQVSPKLGKFLQNGMNQGLSLRDGLDFIKNKIIPPQTPEETVNTESNVTPQNPMDTSLQQPTKKLSPIEQLLGAPQSNSPQSQAALQPQQGSGQQGSGQQALMAILQKLQQARGIK